MALGVGDSGQASALDDGEISRLLRIAVPVCDMVLVGIIWW